MSAASSSSAAVDWGVSYPQYLGLPTALSLSEVMLSVASDGLGGDGRPALFWGGCSAPWRDVPGGVAYSVTHANTWLLVV